MNDINSVKVGDVVVVNKYNYGRGQYDAGDKGVVTDVMDCGVMVNWSKARYDDQDIEDSRIRLLVHSEYHLEGVEYLEDPELNPAPGIVMAPPLPPIPVASKLSFFDRIRRHFIIRRVERLTRVAEQLVLLQGDQQRWYCMQLITQYLKELYELEPTK